MPLRNMLLSRSFRLVGSLSVLAGIFSAQPYRPMVFMGDSMSPTYHNHEIALATTDTSHLQVGDIVVLDSPVGTIVKRIAYLPGDKINRYKFLGKWHDLVGEYGLSTRTRKNLKLSSRTVPEGYMYVLGDNSEVSVDSRAFGMIPLSSVKFVLVTSKAKN
ncbi:MAG: signal peptidase I [Armatimonadetes bacterium]|nr:signal peptidase I [Armatimonadota bacterium]